MAFWDNIRFPYFNFQELNLDWIMSELKRIAGFMPQDGNVGDILTRKTDGASWEPPEAVNININALPEDTEIGDNDQLVFYDISAQANRKIKPPNLLDSMMSNGTPLMDGTASAGTSKKPARYDHKHPTDTSRQAALSGTQMNAVNSGAPANAFSSGKLNIANGGTGADTAYQARINLDIPMHIYAHGISNNGSLDIDIADNEKGIIVCTGVYAAAKLMAIYSCNSSGTISYRCVDTSVDLESGQLAFSKSTRLLTISNTTGSSAYAWKIVFDVTEIDE